MWQKEAKMNISSLHMGSTPPVFNFIRALEQPPEGDHVVSFLSQTTHGQRRMWIGPVASSLGLDCAAGAAAEEPTDDKCCLQAYEATMEFHSGDDMNAEISVLTRGGTTTTFYISHLHIEGKVRTISGLPLCLATIVTKTVPYSLSLV